VQALYIVLSIVQGVSYLLTLLGSINSRGIVARTLGDSHARGSNDVGLVNVVWQLLPSGPLSDIHRVHLILHIV
jgi:hypothetical protein